MFIHDTIKRMYSSMGYLPGYPYYLISDEEMFEAFLKPDGFFNDFYPCPSENLREAYGLLHNYIAERIQKYCNKEEESLPDWIYSYMIMRPITFDSPEDDIAYLSDLAGLETPLGAPEFGPEMAEKCYAISIKWIQKQPSKYSHRPPTMFGETHVTKCLRLDQANILLNTEGI